MDQSLDFLSENILNLMRGAQLMLFVVMCVSLHPKRKKNAILNHLFWMLIIRLVFLLGAFGRMFDSLEQSYLYGDFKVLTDLLLVPLVGSYLLKVIIPDLINWRRVLLLLFPIMLFALIHVFTQSKLVFILSLIYTLLVAVVIFIFNVFIAGYYDRFLKKRFSNIDNKTVGWVRVITYVFSLWYILWAFVAGFGNEWIYPIYYLFVISMWIFIYHYSVKHITVVSADELFERKYPKTEELTKSEIDNDVPLETTIDLLGQKLQIYIDEYHPWLNHSLTLQELATALGTNRTYLSEYLNNRLNTTFYDYINGFRIRYACQLLLSDPESQLANVSEQPGFNSLSTFRRAFEKHVGTTPAKYRNKEGN